MNNINLDIDPKIKSGFIIPENYFDDFSEKITNKIVTQPQVISVFKKRKTWIYAAAALFMLQISIVAVNNYKQSQSNIDSQTLENYLVENELLNDGLIENELTTLDMNKFNNDVSIADKTIENELLLNENLEEIILN